MRWLLVLAGVLLATPALSHASLVATQPPDGAVLDVAPQQLVLTFNEPVEPTALRLIKPDGDAILVTEFAREANSVVVAVPNLGEGTHIVSWRAVSADGHPVSGSFLFSVRIETANSSARPSDDPLLRPAIWGLRVAIYVALFVGVSGSFFAAWISGPAPLPIAARRILQGVMLVGLLSVVPATALQGVDLLGGAVADAFGARVFAAAIASSYFATLAVAAAALTLGMVGLAAPHPARRQSLAADAPAIARGRSAKTARARVASTCGLLALGIAFSLSGHASNAPPKTVTWLLVLIHTATVAFWTGSLIPLAFLLGDQGPSSLAVLRRFSAVIPHALIPLAITGGLLILVQLRSVTDLWTTDYGRILAAKLAAVAGLVAIAAFNRFRLTPLTNAHPAEGARALRRAIVAEVALVFAIFGLVAGWRFTPPPRATASSAAVAPAKDFFTHLHGGGMAANVTVSPGETGPAFVTVELLTEQLEPLAAQEMTVALSNPIEGIEPLTRQAKILDDGKWRAEGFVLPIGGTWSILISARISTFDLRSVAGAIAIRDAGPIPPP